MSVTRAFFSACWGVFLAESGSLISENGFEFFLIVIPLLGLPWLLFTIADRSPDGERMRLQAALTALFGGAFFTLLCTLPAIPIWLLIRRFFL
jgi:hypothetical protein